MASATSKMENLSISEVKPKAAPKKAPPKGGKKKVEGAALIGIDIRKEDDLADWYQQVLSKGEMIDYYDVSGCYILLPASMAIWESIKAWFDAQIRTIGVKPAYFPIFISEDALQREKDHVEGFAAEVAWVTRG